MDAKFLGKWRLVKSENVDEFMKASNINYMMRKLGGSLSFDMEFKNDGDLCHMLMTSTFKNKDTAFKFNEAFDDTDLSGKTHRVTFRQEDGKLKSKREPTKDGDQYYVNEYSINEDGLLVITSTITSVEPRVTSIRYLERIE